MSNKENYPEWGAFGAPDSQTKPVQRPATDHPTGTAFEYIMSYNSDGMPTLTPEPHDTEEILRFAHSELARERDRIMKIKEQKRLRLVRCDHPLKDFIEKAMERAGVTSFDEVEPVWRQLVAMADDPDAPAYVTGYAPSNRAIRYQGKNYNNSGLFDHFNREALAQLFRRQKAHANPRESTQGHAL